MTNKEIIEKMYVDFVQGNVPEILNAMSDNVVINTPGTGIITWAGTWKGKEGAMEFFKNVGTSTTYLKFETSGFVAEGDKVVAIGNADFTSAKTGKSGKSDWVMVWTLQDGKATHVLNQWDTEAIAESETLS